MNNLHFILTRFNLRTEVFLRDRNNVSTLSREWYTERFNLFESICLPSVKNQINKNFYWLIFFDINTPEEYLEKIHDYSCSSPSILPFFIDGMESFNTECKSQINKIIEEKKIVDNVITTRLDNDDAIHENFTQTVSQYSVSIDSVTVIDFPIGYLLKIQDQKAYIRKKIKYFGPFLTLVEPVDNFTTIYHGKHRSWKNKNVGLITAKQEKMWIQTIHSRNLANTMRNKEYLRPSSSLLPFHVDMADNKIQFSPFFVLVDTAKIALKKANKFSKKLVKKLLKRR